MSKSNGSMNRVFRVVWNAAKSVWQAVSEIATGHAGGQSGKAARQARRGWRWSALQAGTLVILSLPAAQAQTVPAANALPTGGNVVAGAATISTSTSGNRMDINQSTAKAAIDWQTFDIGSAAHVHFQQVAGGVALNRVFDTNASQIYGKLTATGQVFLVNPNGVLFAPGSQVDVGGIVASTLNIKPEDFMAGNYRFQGGSSNAIINQGNITARGEGNGGTIAMIAAKIVNQGTLTATKGNVLLGAGSKVTLDLGGPVKLQVEEGAINALIESGGAIRAQGGTVLLTAKAAGDLAATVINHTGLIEAQTLSTGERGEVVLLADGGELKISGKIDVSAPVGGAVIPVATIDTQSADLQLASTLTLNGEPLPQQPVPTAPSDVLPVTRPENPTPAPTALLLGGKIVATGKYVMLEDGAHLTASGKDGGGSVLVGGSYQNTDPSVYQATGVVMKAGAKIEANATEVGNGGTAVVWSDITNADSATKVYGTLEAKGGANGGDGGRIETSGHYLDANPAKADATAPMGKNGEWLLDPYTIYIQNSSPSGDAYSPTFTPSQDSYILASSIEASLNAGTNVTLNANGTAGAGTGVISVTTTGAINATGTGSLTFNAADRTQLFANITTKGAQTYNGKFVAAGSNGSNITLTTTNSDITFNGDVNSGNGQQSLTINQGAGNVWFKGAVGATNALASLSVNGTGTTTVGWDTSIQTNAGALTTTTGGVTTTGAQTYNGNLRVGGTNTTLTTTNAAVTVLGSISSYRSGTETGVFSTAGTYTFTPTFGTTSATLLVVGGGGGGSNGGAIATPQELWRGGGGGAGGVYYTTTQSLTGGTGISITVGAGGTSNVMGGTSTFGTIDAGGGGFGSNGRNTDATLTSGLESAGFGGGGGARYVNSAWGYTSKTASVGPQYNGGAYSGNAYVGATGAGNVSNAGGGAGVAGSGTGGTSVGYAGNGGNGLAFAVAGTTYSVSAGGAGGGANDGSSLGYGGKVNGVVIGGSATGSGGTNGGSASGYGSGGAGASYNVNNSNLTYGGGSGSGGVVAVSYNYTGLTGAGLTINAGSGKVDLRGAIGSNSLSSLTVNSTAVDSAITGTLSGSTAFTYDGTNAGVLTLSGANTHSGVNTVNGGILKLGNAGALGSGSVVVGSTNISTASLDLNGFDTTKAMTLRGYGAGGTASAGTVGALTNSSATAVTASGNLTLDTDTTVGSSFGNITLSGTISGVRLLTKVGTDTLTLTKNNNSYSGGTTVRAGTLVVPTTGAMGSGVLTIGGSGTLDLQKAHTATSLSMTGGSIVNSSSDASSLTVTGTSSLSGNINTKGTQTYTGAMSLIGNATFTSNDNDITFGSTVSGFSNFTVNQGTGKATFNGVVGSTALASLSVNGTGNTQLGSGATGISTTGTQTYAGNLVLGANTTLTTPVAGNSIAGVVSGAFGLTYAGTTNGVLTLGSANTYTGATTVSGGTLKMGVAGALDGTSAITVGSASTSTASLDLNGFDITKAMTLNGYGVGGNGGAVGALTNSSATAATASGNISIPSLSYIGGIGDITLGGIISGAGLLRKVGADTVTLANSANSYSGGTTLSAGTLVVPTTGSMGTGALNISSGATLDLQKAQTVASLTTAGTITNSSTDASSLSVTGTSSIGGGITTKGTQTYTGATTLTAGSTLTSGGSDITFGSTVNGGFGLTVAQGTGKATFNNIVGGTTALSSLAVTGSGATWLGSSTSGVTTTGAQSYAGDLYLGNATTSLTTTNSAVTIGGATNSYLSGTENYVYNSNTSTTYTVKGTPVGNATLLLVGGGGAGGSAGYASQWVSGGGGAGAYYLDAALALTAGASYTVQAGLGGSTVSGSYAGTTTTFGSWTAGGGAGGNTGAQVVATGSTKDGFASGGSYRVDTNTAFAGATPSPNQSATSTTRGGSASTSGGAGGGAGASSSGANGATAGGAGGGGTSTTVGGATYYFSAGGGGGSRSSTGGAGGVVGATTVGGAGGGTNTAGGNASSSYYGSGGGGAGSNSTTIYNGGSGSGGLVALSYNYTGEKGANLTINSGSGQVSMGAANNMGNVSITSTATNSKVDGVISGTGNLTYAGTQAGVLALNAANTYTGTTTVSGGTLKLGAGGTAGAGAITVGSSATSTASLDLNGQAITNAINLNGYGAGGNGGTVGALTNSGADVALAASTAVALSTASAIGGNNGNITLANVISGTNALTKVGSNTLTLTGVNTYTGATTINGGTLQIGGAGKLNSGSYAGAISIASGAAFQYSSSAAQTLSGVISGAGNLIKDTGTSTLTLSGTNTYTGSTTVNAGTLSVTGSLGSGTYAGAINLGAGGTLDINKTSSQTLSGVISGDGRLTKYSSGTLVLSGASTFTGGITLSTGTLQAGNNAAFGTGDITILSTGSGSTLDIYGKTIANNVSVTGHGIGGSTGTTGAIISGTGPTGKLTGNVTLTGETSVGNNTYDFEISGIISGAFKLNKLGGNTVTLSGLNTYSGGTDVENNSTTPGILKAGSSQAFGDSAGLVTVVSGSGMDLNGQTIGNAFSVAGSGVSSAGVIYNSNTTTAATASGNIAMTADSSFGGAGNMSLTGVVSGAFNLSKTGGGILTLGGANANTYTGTTTVGTGTLKLGHASGLGNATSAVTISGGATLDLNGYTLARNLWTNSAGVGSNGGLINSNTSTSGGVTGTVTLGGGAPSFGGAGNFSISGAVSGGYSVTKVGAGEVSLNGLNTYTGTTTISGGTLKIGGSGNLTAGTYTPTISIASGATFKYSSSAAQRIDGVISGAGNVVKDTSTSSTLTLYTQTNTYTGSTSIQAGTLKIFSATSLNGTSGITVGADATSLATLDLNGYSPNLGSRSLVLNGYGVGGATGSVGAIGSSSGNSTLTGDTITLGSDVRIGNSYGLTLGPSTSTLGMAGTATLTKVGAGDLTMNGTGNTYTGNVKIETGNLNLAGNFASGSNIDIASGAALKYTSSSNGSLNGLISGAGDLQLGSNVTLTLGGTAANTYSGSTDFGTSGTTGTLKAGKTNAFGTSIVFSSSSNTSVIDVNGQSLANEFRIRGWGASNGGALINSNTSAAGTVSGPVWLNGSALIGGAGTLNITGAITLNVAGSDLIFVGAGAKNLTNVNSSLSRIASGSNIGALTVNAASAINVTTSGAAINGVTYNGISTNNAPVTLTSTKDNGTNGNSGAAIYNNQVISTGTGDVTLTANTFGTAANYVGTGVLTVRPYTDGRGMTLMGTTLNPNPSQLVLDAGSLSFLTNSYNATNWSKVVFGSSTTGNMSVIQQLTINSSSMEVITAGNIGMAAKLTSNKTSGTITVRAASIGSGPNGGIVQSGTNGTWMVYLPTVESGDNTNYPNTFNNLNSQNKAIWGQTASSLTPSALIATYGNGGGSKGYYVFAETGTAVANVGNLTKTYGTDNSASLPSTLSYSGTALTALANVYLANDVADVILTAPTVSSAGTAQRAAKGTYDITASGGAAKSGYTLSIGTSGTMTVNPKALNVTGASGVDKTYDGTTNVTSNGSYAVTSADIVSGDTVTVSGATVYDSANAGSRTVQQGSLALGGTDSANYTLAWTNGSGTIAKKALTVTPTGDAKFLGDADNLTAGATYSGFVAGETSAVVSGSVVITRAGAGSVEGAGTYATALSASTSTLSASNYSFNYQPGSFTIVPAGDLLVKAGSGTASYGSAGTYSGMTAQYKNGSGNLVNLTQTNQTGNTFTFSDGSGGGATFTLNAGGAGDLSSAGLLKVGSYAVDGTNVIKIGNNFTGGVSFAGSLAVNPLAATLTTSAVSKTYDGTTSANGGATVSNLKSGDTVSVAGVGGFADKNVGSNKSYSMTGLTLSGVDADNYYLTSTTASGTGEITAKTITASYTGTDKVYDRSTVATVSGSASGMIVGDHLTFGQSASFADWNAGTNKAINVTGITLGGADMGNYLLSSTSATTTANITQKSLTTSYTASNKEYNGNTTAAVSGSLSGVISGDTVSQSQTANFADKNVGTGKTVNITSITLTGADASNYSLQTNTAGTTADITAKAITVAYTGQDKVYDRSNTATVTGSAAAMVVGDDLGFTQTASFGDWNVGTSKTIGISGIALMGNDASNYSLNNSTATANANITAKTLTTSYTGTNKVYDGTTATTASGSLVGVLAGDTVTLSDSGASFASKNAGTGKTVTITGLALGGAAQGNYQLAGTTTTTTADITQKSLTVDYTGTSKTYDGTTAATVSSSSGDVLAGDVVNFSQTSATFNDKTANTGKTITVSGISLSGTDAGNYALSATTASTSADINAKTITVAYTGSDKVYDGNVTATVTGSSLGLIGGDAVGFSQTALFGDKNAAANKTVSISGIGLTGLDAGNYYVGNASGEASTTASITKKALTVAYTGTDRVYDQTTNVTVTGSAVAKVTGDDLAYTQTASFADKNAGANKTVSIADIALTGNDKDNYSLQSTTATTTASITAKTLSVSYTGTNKTYDGNTSVTVAGSTADVLSGDTVNISQSAAFASKNAGSARTINVTGITLTGADAGNYALAANATTTSADIAQKNLTATYSGQNKVYDGLTTANVTGASTDIIAGDAVSFTQTADFVVGGVSDKNAGTGKTINVSSIALAGGDANNYALQNTTATTTATITRKALTVGYSGTDKVYDASTTATVTGSSADKVGGDNLSYTQTAVFADKNVGTGKNISITGITLDGTDKDNYLLQNSTANTSASISKATLNVAGASAQDKTYDGTTVATVTGAGVTALGSDDLTLHTGTASFANKDAASNKAVTTAYTITGADAGNYTLVQPAGLTATISKKMLTVTANDDAKFYGEADSFTAGVKYTGFVAGETSAVLGGSVLVTRANAGTTTAGVYLNELSANTTSLTATNYDFTSPATGTYTIVAANQLLVKSGNGSTVYGTAGSFTPVVQYKTGGGNIVTLNQTAHTGNTYTFDDGNSGTATFTLVTGGAGDLSAANLLKVGNYAVGGTGFSKTGTNFDGSAITYTGNLAVTPLQVSFNTGSMSKVYDGTTTATGTVTPSNLQTNDLVTIGYSSGVFASKNVGSSVAFTLNGLSLSGTDAGNYFLATTTDSGTGAITAKDITVGYTGVSKVYNGNTTATVIGASSGLITGDAVGFSQTANFVDKNVGTGKSIAISSISLTGADAGNYNVINAGGLATASADITRKNLTASFAGTNKTYDGSTTATVTGSSVDMVGGDTLGYTQTAAFADKNAGTGKLVNVTGIALTGADAGNYELQNTTASTTANIDKKALTASYTAANRTYDGTTAIVVAGGSADIVSGDTVSFTETAALASKAAGNGRIVNVSNIALSGTDGGNYALQATTAMTTADIAQKSLTASYTAANKTYDGLTAATVTGSSADIVAGDTVSFAQTANFAGKNAGNGKNVSITGISLGGADGANYLLTATTASAMADIAKKAMTVGYSGTGKTYDGTTTATVTGSSADKVMGDNLSYTQTATYTDKNAGAGKLVNVSGIALAGTDAGNYDLQNTTANTTATIAQKALTASYSATDRTYDGTTGITVSGSSSDIVTNDVVNLSQSAVLASKNAGNGVTVNVSNIALSGADAGNYALQATTATTTANIAKATLSGITGITASNKTYDGTAAATLVTGSAVFGGKMGSDNLSIGSASGSFDSKNVNTGKTVTISSIVLGGTDAGNYNAFTGPLSTQADITARTLTVGWTAADKVYDGNATATVTNTDNRIANDVLSVDFTGATFAGKNVANGKTVSINGIALSGADAGNYTVANSATTTANITAKALTLSLGGSPTKVYDGTTAFSLTGVTPLVDGKVTNDDLTVGTGNVTGFADKNVGTNKAVTFTGFALTGTDAGNYSLVSGTAQSNASITAATISGVTGITAANKVYDAGTAAALTTTGAGFTGRFGSDVLTVATASGAFVDKNVANGKTVNISGITLGGADAGNYVLANDTASAQADITTKTLTVSYTGVNKVYDAGLGATVTTSDDRLGSDVLTINRTATFDNTGGTGKNVGAGKTINVTGVSLSGTDANNYSVVATGATTADISAKAITISGITAGNKTYDGTTAATVSTAGAGGWIAGDNIGLSATGVFGDKNVADGKTVTLTSSYSGADAGNYIITNQASTTANITRLSSVTWVGGATGNWFDPANWTGGAVPDLSNVANVVIPNGVVVSFNNTMTAPAQAGTVNVDSIGAQGGLDVSSGTLAVANNLQLANYSQSGGSVSTGGNFTVTDSFAQTGGSIAATGNVGITQIAGGTSLGNITAGGTLGVTAAGNITQVNPSSIVASGTTTLTSTGGNIALDSTTNDFATVNATGGNISLADANGLTVALVATGNSTLSAGGNLSVSGSTNNLSTTTINGGTTTFGTITVAGDLSTTSAGAVGQSGAMSVNGAASFSAAGQNVTLDNAGNDFGGTVSATANNLALADVNGIELGNITAGGTLGVTAAGDITQANPSSIVASGVTTLASTGGNITLDSTSNDFATVNATGGNISLADRNGFALGALTATGNLLATSTTGSVTVSGTLNVGGNNPFALPPSAAEGSPVEAAIAVVQQQIGAVLSSALTPSGTAAPSLQSAGTLSTAGSSQSALEGAAALGKVAIQLDGFRVIELSSDRVAAETLPAAPGEGGQIIQLNNPEPNGAVNERGGSGGEGGLAALQSMIRNAPPGSNLFVIDGGIRMPRGGASNESDQ